MAGYMCFECCCDDFQIQHLPGCSKQAQLVDAGFKKTDILGPILDKKVRRLWRVNIISYHSILPKLDAISTWHVATNDPTSRTEILKLVRTRFSDSWWQSHAVASIEEVGHLHILDKDPLYEEAD